MVDRLIEPGERLPALPLQDSVHRRPLRLADDGRFSAAMVVLHGRECAACTEYAATLARGHTDLAGWDCRLWVVVTDHSPDATSAPWPHLEDAVVAAAAAAVLHQHRIPVPGVVMMDPWHEVAAVMAAGTAHAFPPVAELLDWARYLATKCPECEGEAR